MTKKLTNREHNRQIEQWVIKQFVEAVKQGWYVKECPIISIRPEQLSNGNSMADGIISCDNRNKWIEVTLASRSPEDLVALLRQQRGDLRPNYDEVHSVNLHTQLNGTIEQISMAIYNKNGKKFSDMVHIVGSKGTLIIVLNQQDPFHDKEELAKIVGNFDEHVLYLLNCGKSFFDEIYLLSYIRSENGMRIFVRIANQMIMHQIQLRQSSLDKLREELSYTTNIAYYHNLRP